MLLKQPTVGGEFCYAEFFRVEETIEFTKESESFSVKILKTEKKCLKKGKRWGTMVSSGRKW